MHTHTRVHTHTPTHTCTYTHTHTHIHFHTCIHTHTHTHSRIPLINFLEDLLEEESLSTDFSTSSFSCEWVLCFVVSDFENSNADIFFSWIVDMLGTPCLAVKTILRKSTRDNASYCTIEPGLPYKTYNNWKKLFLLS